MKRYTLFAGVNGAGKTSIYKSVFFNENYNGKLIWKDKIMPEWANTILKRL